MQKVEGSSLFSCTYDLCGATRMSALESHSGSATLATLAPWPAAKIQVDPADRDGAERREISADASL